MNAGLSVRRVSVELTRELRRDVLRPFETVEEIVAGEAPGTIAVGAFAGSALIGCGMITPGADPRGWRIRGMAVAAEHRGGGTGAAILGELLALAREGGARRVWCNARSPAVTLYERAGFRCASEEFELPRIGVHHVMERRSGLGVLALGDSITNGGGELQWGVAMKSWAEWVARGLGMPYTGFAVDGATVGHVLSEQIPAAEHRLGDVGVRYDLGVIWIGVNDVRALDWDARAFARDLGRAVGWLRERCDRRLLVTTPLDLGRPRADSRRLHELNASVTRAAAADGAVILDLADLRARNLVMSDHVHLTALGQVWVAEQALDRLTGAGLAARARPRAMIVWEENPVKRLRSDVTYCYRHAKVSGRAAILRIAGALR